MKVAFCPLYVVLAIASAGVHAQAWSPQRNVEIVVGSAPGGSNIAFNHVNQRPGDGHTLLIGTTALMSNHITGLGSLYYADFTPIASLFNDYTVYAVNAASPIATGKDLAARLKDPNSVATGFATTLGSHNHVAAGLLVKALGGNARDLKAVAFKGSAEAITALLGSHIELVTTAAGNAAPHVAAGRMRVVAVAAPQRLGGSLAHVPTWTEQGVDVVIGGWRAIMGPRGLTPAQVAYWEGVLHKATLVPEWQSDLGKNYWSNDFVTSAQFRKDLENDYAEMKLVLADLGLAKR